MTVSTSFTKAVNTGGRWVTEITCTVPGGEPVNIGPAARLPGNRRGPGWTSCVVSSSNTTGVRYSARLVIVPAAGSDTYGIVATPGALFTIRQGFDFGGGHTELVNFGKYEAAAGGVSIIDGDINLRLVDLWQRLERCRFTSPHAPAGGTRAELIAEAVSEAIPGTTIITTADGGMFSAGAVWDQSRTQFITDLARDGSLDVYFNADGAFVIRPEPIIDTKTVAATFRTGTASNIETADRERPFDRLYNTVIVSPQSDTQTWTRQTATIDDPNDPRWPGTPPLYLDGKIGLVPFFYSSPTLMSDTAAKAAAVTILQRVQGTTETLKLGVLGSPTYEVGMTVAVAHEATDTDPGFGAIHLLESFDFNCETGEQTADTRSSTLASVEES